MYVDERRFSPTETAKHVTALLDEATTVFSHRFLRDLVWCLQMTIPVLERAGADDLIDAIRERLSGRPSLQATLEEPHE